MGDNEMAVVEAWARAGGDGIVEPDVYTGRELAAVFVQLRVTEAEARAWGASLAVEQGRRVAWPWWRNAPHEPVRAHWLKTCDLTRGESPWDRLRQGLSNWRAWQRKRANARARAQQSSAASPPQQTPQAPIASKESLLASAKAFLQESRRDRFGGSKGGNNV